jgi:hypothetical protein
MGDRVYGRDVEASYDVMVVGSGSGGGVSLPA